jgi:hypothetical protein
MTPFGNDSEKVKVHVTMKSGELNMFFEVTELEKEDGWIMIGHTVIDFPDKYPQFTLIPESEVAMITVREVQS